jgi:hypothetical protein
MTTLEILQKTLEAYENALEEIKDMSYEDIQDYLDDKVMGCGLCFYIDKRFLADGYNLIKSAMEKMRYYKSYLCITPINAYNCTEIFKCMEVRIIFLKNCIHGIKKENHEKF